MEAAMNEQRDLQQSDAQVTQQDVSSTQPDVQPKQQKVKKKFGRSPALDKPIRITIFLQDDHRKKLEVLARGVDRSVSWVIRDLIDAALVADQRRIRAFAESQARADVESAKIRGKALTEPTTAQAVITILEADQAETLRTLEENPRQPGIQFVRKEK